MGIKVDFVGLNTLIYDPIVDDKTTDPPSMMTASIGYSADQGSKTYRNGSFGLISEGDSLVALNLHRNGPYAHPTWKQVRNGDKPIVKYYKKNSIFTYILDPSDLNTYKIATEPAVVYKNSPLKYSITTTDAKDSIIKVGYSNNLSFFANDQTNIDHEINIQDMVDDGIYNKFKLLYLDDNTSTIIDSVSFLEYSTTIFPADKNNLGNRRNRPTYSNDFWRSNRDDRGRSRVKSFNMIITSQSIWSLDASSVFETYVGAFTSSDTAKNRYGDPGILQNYETHIHGAKQGSAAERKAETSVRIRPRSLYALKHTLTNTSSVVGPTGMFISQTGSHTSLSTSSFGAGNAVWDCENQVGYYTGTKTVIAETRPISFSTVYDFNVTKKEPFYDSYEQYADIMRFKAKGYSILPEYRISEHYDEIKININSARSNTEENFDNNLEVTGGILNNSKADEGDFYEIYSFSDFIGEDFQKILDDHGGFSIPNKIKFKAKALLKFLPYDGFYPAERSVQLGDQFRKSYFEKLSFAGTDVANPFKGGGGSNEAAFRTFLAPFYAPGIMYNTIKSGLGVDFPIFTKPYHVYEQPISLIGGGGRNFLIISGSNTRGDFDYRIPFEGVINPDYYVSNLEIHDMFPHPSASMRVTASLASAGNSKYRAMAENFFAEVPNFFLDGFSTISSDSDNTANFGVITDPNLNSYAMRVKLYRSVSGSSNTLLSEIGYVVPQDPTGSGADTPRPITEQQVRETFTMYSRPSAFGPPTALKGISDGAAHTRNEKDHDSRGGFNFPFTPPYYHGDAWADIVYTPPANTAKANFSDIISNCTVTYSRVDEANWPAGDGLQGAARINQNAMQISASINLFGSQPTDAMAEDGVQYTVNPTQWVISPKFETPMFNFNDVDARSTVTMPTLGSESVPRGMWHQYGVIPTDDDVGVFMQVSDVPNSWISEKLGHPPKSTGTGSLADLVGFSKDPIKLGQVRTGKTIKEAVVIIPFIQRSGEKSFINVAREDVDSILAPGNGTAINSDGNPIGSSIQNMVQSMQDYVLPPIFDFISDTSISPFVMYFLEFEHILDQGDLVDMWQNVTPNIGQTFVEKTVEIEHDINSAELLGNILTSKLDSSGAPAPAKLMETSFETLRFMVFKVKQKANTSYNEQVYVTHGFKETSATGKDAKFNWPYDFFSLIEYTKVDMTVRFGEPNTIQERDQAGALGTKSKGEKQDRKDIGTGDKTKAKSEKKAEAYRQSKLEALAERLEEGAKTKAFEKASAYRQARLEALAERLEEGAKTKAFEKAEAFKNSKSEKDKNKNGFGSNDGEDNSTNILDQGDK